MTFSTNIKNEITKDFNNTVEDLLSLNTYLKFNSVITKNRITIMLENASITRWLFKLLKNNYNIEVILTMRTIKRFKKRNLYILDIKEKVNTIIADIDNLFQNIFDASLEEKKAFLKGLFLSCGSINDRRKINIIWNFHKK